MKAVLLIDFGSTYTKLTAVDVEAGGNEADAGKHRYHAQHDAVNQMDAFFCFWGHMDSSYGGKFHTNYNSRKMTKCK